jgi:FkbM family methyltransferase
MDDAGREGFDAEVAAEWVRSTTPSVAAAIAADVPTEPAILTQGGARAGIGRVELTIKQAAVDIARVGSRPFRRYATRVLHEELEGLRARLRDQAAADVERTVQAATAELIAQIQWSHTKIQADSDLVASLLERIERYSLASARRVVIPVGSETLLVRSESGYLLCSAADESILARLVDTGDLELGTRLLIERLLAPDDVFVDVGANVGVHSLAAARSLRGRGHVIAFEPYKPSSELLTRSLALNGYSHISTVHPLALSDREGTRQLHLGTVSAHRSLLPFDDQILEETVEVAESRLDAVVAPGGRVDLLKIDAKGSELAVLRGAQRVIADNPQIGIIAEFGQPHLQRLQVSPAEWLRNFTDLGFDWRAVHPETGRLEQLSRPEISAMESVILFFAQPTATGWRLAELDA